MGNQQQDYCSELTRAKLPDDTRCDTRRLHVYGLLPSSVAHGSQMTAFSLVRELQKETMETMSTVHRLLDGSWSAACRLLSRFTYTAVTVADLLNQSDCTRSLTLSVYYFVSYITYFIVVTDTGDVEDGNNTASVSSSTYFNVNIAH